MLGEALLDTGAVRAEPAVDGLSSVRPNPPLFSMVRAISL